MTKLAITLLAAFTLAQPSLSAAADNATTGGAKTSSFVPHPHAKQHVYGAPIEPAIVGHHAKNSHRKHTPKKRSSGAPGRVVR